MTNEEFDAALSTTRIKPDSNTAIAAKLVLVNGMSQTEAGKQTDPNLTRQQVNQAVTRIKQAYCESLGVPENWGTITLVLPKDGKEWRAAEELQRKAYSKLKTKN